MSSRIVVCLTVLIFFSVNVNSIDFCGKRRNFDEPKGIIETNDGSKRSKNCTWFIRTPKNSVVYLKILNLQLGSSNNMSNERNCLHISSFDNKWNFLNLCSDTDNMNILSIPASNLLINLEITSDSYLEMIYTSYVVNCTYDKLLCITSRFLPRNPREKCLRGMLTCNPSCPNQAAACGDVCYNIFQQRCDGILNCPNAEDEVGCNSIICPNGIVCSNETKCVEPKQICDKTIDCQNGFDESHCPQSFCEGRGAGCSLAKKTINGFDQDDSIYIIIIILGVLAVLFLCMIFKCLAARQNIRTMLDNPLDIPLPPFRGPGEDSSTADVHPFTDEDFKPGGEVFEGFAGNLAKIKSMRKNMLEIDEGGITFVKPPPGEDVLDKYFHGVKPVLSEELAALATLKISRNMCHGLRKTRSEEKPITKLLFIDNIDEDISGNSDTDDNEGISNWKKGLRRNVYPKSDTDYVRRKRVEITIV